MRNGLIFAALLAACLCVDNAANAWGGRIFGGRCAGGSCYSASRSCYGGGCYSGGSCYSAPSAYSGGSCYSGSCLSGRCAGGSCPLTSYTQETATEETPGACLAVQKVEETPAPCASVNPPVTASPTLDEETPAPCESVETVEEPACPPCGAVQTIRARRLPVLCKGGVCRIVNVPRRAAQTTVSALFNAINAVRGRALAFDDRLQAQAQYQAQRMAATGRLFHSGLGWEICAQTWTNTDAVGEWLDSKMGHREIMLGNFSRCGAATCADSAGRVWSCARFE